MNKLLVQARATLGRLTSWVRAHRTAVIDHGKTALIVVLCLSAVVLAGKTGLFGGTDIYIATHNHGVDIIRGKRHQSLIEGQLQGEQRLRETLPPLPPEHGDGSEYLA